MKKASVARVRSRETTTSRPSRPCLSEASFIATCLVFVLERAATRTLCGGNAHHDDDDLKRRSFLQGAGLAAAATAVAAPAIAQSAPEIRWRLTSSFPKSLDTIYGTAQTFAKYMAEATDNKFQIQTFAAGEIVGGLQALDAVQNGAVECAHTPIYFYIGKDPTLAFGTGVPFGLNARQQHSWWHFAGGKEIINEVLAQVTTAISLRLRQLRHPDGRLLPQGDQEPSTT